MKSFGAVAGVWGRGVALSGFCAAVFAAAAFCADPAPAQNREEVPLGTFDLKPSLEPQPAGAPSHDGISDGDSGSGVNAWFMPGFDFSAGSSESTEALFGRAVAALEAGRSDEAQGLLEKVIAKAPGSALATKARRYLASLYSRSNEAGAVEINTGTVNDEARPATANATLPLRTVDPAAILARTGGTHVSAAVEEEFVLEAGDRVFFSAGSAELGVRARTVLQAQARFLAAREDMAAFIEGHADDGMAASDEQVRLSQARAEAVRDRLIADGIGPERLIAIARGQDAPVSACGVPACAAQNRRAVTILSSPGALKALKSAHVPEVLGSAKPRPVQ